MPGKAAKVVVSERQLGILERLRRSQTEPVWVVQRADISRQPPGSVLAVIRRQ